MISFVLSTELTEKTILPCYFFFGEEMYLSEVFLEEIKNTLIPEDEEDFRFEKISLEENSWLDVFDSARTVPFFLSSWRVIIVDIPRGKKELLSATENKIIQDYFSSPPDRTVLVLRLPGKVRKNSPILRVFSSFSGQQLLIRELKPLRGKKIYAWLNRMLEKDGKRATPEAASRLVELTGSDMALLNNELEKVVTAAYDKNMIELDDVNQVSGWVKSFFEYEISDCLQKADYNQVVIVLNKLLKKEGVKEERVLATIAKYFQEILQAKLWLKERAKSRKEIFTHLRPQILEKFGSFYTQKFREFFAPVDRMSLTQVSDCLQQLERIDLRIKTSDASLQALLEGFLFRYCQGGRRRPILPGSP